MKRVELGCGPNKRLKDAVSVDILDLPGVDIVADLNQGMPFFEDNSLDEIYSHHVLEHLDDLSSFMKEVHRILKPGGLFWGEVPHFSNPYYYSDPTHRVFFGLYTFNYFSKSQKGFARRVPSFYSDIDFDIEQYRLIFKSITRRNRLFAFISNRLNIYFNKSIIRQERYEEFLSSHIYCYELGFKIRKPS